MPALRVEASGAEVLDLCHGRRRKQSSLGSLCPGGRRLTLALGEQAASRVANPAQRPLRPALWQFRSRTLSKGPSASSMSFRRRDFVADFLSLPSLAFWPGSLRLRLRKLCCSCSFQALICADLCAKRANCAAFKKRLSFVFKYFLASFPLFSIFCNYLFVPIVRAVRLCFVFRQPRRLSTTMCPQYDHNYRLS